MKNAVQRLKEQNEKRAKEGWFDRFWLKQMALFFPAWTLFMVLMYLVARAGAYHVIPIFYGCGIAIFSGLVAWRSQKLWRQRTGS